MINNRGLYEFYNSRWSETNMVTSLFCAHKWLEKYECIVSYSDIFYKKTAIELLINSKSDLAITYDPNWKELWMKRFVNPLTDAETFKINKNFLSEIGGVPKNMREIEGQYMGLLKFSPKRMEIFS